MRWAKLSAVVAVAVVLVIGSFELIRSAAHQKHEMSVTGLK